MKKRKMSIRDIARSDELVGLREMFSTDGIFAQLGHLVQIELVLDANAVLADIRWLVCKAKCPSARTNLLESIDAETIVAYAPTYIEIEIAKNIPKIAEEGIDASLLLAQWEVFKSKIRFVECGGPENGAIDPKDVPYVKLHNITGFPVLSEDPHISKMGAKAISIQVTALAQTYSREAVVEYTIKVGALTTFMITGAMVKAASDLIRSLGQSLRRIPPWAWLLIITGFAFALSVDGVRRWLEEKLSTLPEASKTFGYCLIQTLKPVVLEHQRSQTQANAAKASLLRELET